MSDSPADADKVLAAFRLGWALAEVRGRHRPDRDRELPVALPHHKRPAHALPLFNERKWGEQTIEATAVLNAMADRLAEDDVALRSDDGIGAAGIAELGRNVDKHPHNARGWDEFANAVYKWDCKIQDTLVRWPSRGAAYQLGRGLAEVYWALDPGGDQKGWGGWEFLLGKERCATLVALIERLSDYVDPLRRAAVIGSLEAWRKVAHDPSWRVADEPGLERLYGQTVLWRDLVRGERDADESAGDPSQLRNIGVLVPILRTFWAQLLVGGLSIALAVGGAALLFDDSTESGLLLTILGGLGITATSLYAQAKASALRLVERMRLSFEEALAARHAQLLPPRPAPRSVGDRARRRREELGVRLGADGHMRVP